MWCGTLYQEAARDRVLGDFPPRRVLSIIESYVIRISIQFPIDQYAYYVIIPILCEDMYILLY
jgi:hypothetical protein